MRSKKAVIIILAGIAIAAVPFLLRMREQQRAEQYISQLEEDEDEEESKKAGSRKKEASPYLAEDAAGIVEIPELNIRYPVFEGTGTAQLNEGIGHMEDTAPLCSPGNCVLAGHNGSRRGTFFTNLGSVKAGTEVSLTTKAGVAHRYTVEEMRVVNPYDEWVTAESDTEVLTLFTCAEHGTRRFVCKCVPVQDYGSGRGDAESGNDGNP